MKNKKSLIVGLSLSAVLLVGGGLAYFNQTTDISNKLTTGYFKNEIIEKFTFKDDWQPGEKVTKELGVENTGTIDLVARAKWDETWKSDNGADININSTDPSTSVVQKEFGNSWKAGQDGYYYYDGIIKANQATRDKFLKSITLSDQVDFADTKNTTVYYSTMTSEPELITNNPTTGWAVCNGDIPAKATYNKTVVTGAGRYAKANYTLTLTIQTYQAKKEAVTGTGFQSIVPNTYELMS